MGAGVAKGLEIVSSYTASYIADLHYSWGRPDGCQVRLAVPMPGSFPYPFFLTIPYHGTNYHCTTKQTATRYSSESGTAQDARLPLSRSLNN